MYLILINIIGFVLFVLYKKTSKIKTLKNGDEQTQTENGKTDPQKVA